MSEPRRTTIMIEALGFRAEVDAEVVRGLALHRTLTTRGLSRKYWTITHVRSGLAILALNGDHAHAIRARDMVLELADWTPAGDELRMLDQVPARLDEVITILNAEAGCVVAARPRGPRGQMRAPRRREAMAR